MKKIILFLVILTLTFSACSSDDDFKKKNKIDKKLQKGEKFLEDEEDISSFDFEEEDIYPDFSTELSADVLLEIEEVFYINEMLGFPEGNLMKIHSVCYDDSLDRAYAVGIMTASVAVFENGEIIKYIYFNPKDDKSLKYIDCANGLVFVGTPNSIHKIDGDKLEVVEEEISQKTLFPNNLVYLPGVDVFVIPNLDDNAQMLYDGSSFELIDSLSLGKVSIFENLEDQILLVETGSENNENFHIYFYDPKTSEFVDDYALSFSNTGISLITYLQDTNDLWMVGRTRFKLEEWVIHDYLVIYDLDKDMQGATIDLEIDDPNRIVSGAGKVVVLTENGFDEEGRAGFWGGMQVIDIEDEKTDYIQEIAWRHSSIDIDDLNSLAYITNNDGGSISVVDLLTGSSVEVIDGGTAVEGGAVANDGTVIIRNRLGGSTIIQLDSNSNIIETDSGNWPVGIAYDSDLDLSFFYNMLDGTVSSLKTGSKKLETIFESDLILGDTDAIGDMVYDFTRKILYVVVPGLNNIIAVNAETGDLIKDVELFDYDKAYERLSGPGVMIAGVYEPTGKLITYTSLDKILRIYDSLDDFSLEKEINVPDGKGLKDFPYSLYVDNYYDKIYIGEYIYDAKTFELLGELEHGYAVATIDHERAFMVTRGAVKDGSEELYLTDLEGTLLDELVISEGRDVYARFAYDHNNGYLYAFYLVQGELVKINLLK